MKKIIKCPSCGLSTPYSTDNPFRPFCSERCKLVDLGAWATETYRVPDESTPPDFEFDLFKKSD
ncbi:DNA gyrase inhibitor YacG [Deefgea sp. CFH1-16]|uniref:DNA gyrase inhibitor YacG n=1 Tax=Deefgea sp. CFH1-16 TaxID=2675457 RepID=UPI0015F47565|nr:DNA gyrase inhibitor YacG [Deefgea sp. CFH1-16]MBM5573941.1 DNA gyrase inhibitor YacG [Deefgea sp. CFH1-16]